MDNRTESVMNKTIVPKLMRVGGGGVTSTFLDEGVPLEL